jgi:hypothetical protein
VAVPSHHGPGIPERVAERLRDEFFAKEMLAPDQIVGLKAIIKDLRRASASGLWRD